jgi:oligoendopeptidase F
VPSGTPSSIDLDAYRADADRFIAELDEEYYLHYAGLKDRLELEDIYARHAALMELPQVQALGASVDGDRRIRELWHFGCDGYLGNLTREHVEKLAAIEAELEVTVDGEAVPFRMVRPEMANEPDRGRRERLDRAMWEATEEHLNPIYLDGEEVVRRAIPDLGVSSYVELYERFGFRLKELAAQCEAFLADTERLYEESIDRASRELLGLSLDELARWDVQRLLRSPQWDEGFPAEQMVPALRSTLADLGIDLDSQENITLDIEQRPQKTPRAFCSPIEVPDKVMLVIQPIGGADDWRAFFHEAGHAEHFGNTSRELSMEEKRLGDVAVTEGWAMLMQHLTDEPAWLTRKLDFPRPNEYATEGMLWLLFFVRRYAAKLLYELEFHSTDDIEAMAKRYSEILGDALKFEISEANYLADIDSGFYVTSYLRSWAFESQLRDALRERFGNDWFTRREAGSLLRELWAEGQRPTADELLQEVSGSEIEMAAVGDRIRERLG